MAEEGREGEADAGAKCRLSKVGIVEIYFHDACSVYNKLVRATGLHNGTHGVRYPVCRRRASHGEMAKRRGVGVKREAKK